jgi:hypothetical protein
VYGHKSLTQAFKVPVTDGIKHRIYYNGHTYETISWNKLSEKRIRERVVAGTIISLMRGNLPDGEACKNDGAEPAPVATWVT